MVGSTVVMFSNTVMLVVMTPPVYGQDAENPGLHTHLSTPTWARDEEISAVDAEASARG